MIDHSTAATAAIPTTKTNAPESLLLPDTAAAALLGISRAHLHRQRAAGKFPEAIRLGRKLLFDKAELVAWVEARCPDLATWRAMRSAAWRRAARGG